MRVILLLFFFLSGACGLIYEIVWTKLLTLVIGSTTYSITTVLVAFMGGLALGSYLGGRFIDKRGDPLLAYGILEGLIGIYCLLVPFLINLTEPAFGWFYNRYYTDQFYLFSLARFAICTFILLLPTTMMGATLPILSKYYVKRKKEFGWNVGRLFAVNTLGAVIGSFSAGFLFLPTFGKWKTIVLSASANLLIAFVVIVYRFIKGREDSSSVSEWQVKEEEIKRTNGEVTSFEIGKAVVYSALFAYAVNGFSGMAYQITWTRAFTLSFGSSTYSFSAIVTVFILGLAVGSAYCARMVDRLKNPIAYFGWVQIAIGYLASGVAVLLGRLPLWMIKPSFEYEGDYFKLLAIKFVIVFIFIILPTFLMGMAFPLAVKIVSMGKTGVGKPVGLAYGWNTVGAILGSFCAGFFLIPVVGIEKTIFVANIANWVAGALLLFVGFSIVAKLPKKAIMPLVPAVVGIVGVFFLPSWDPYILNAGPFVYASNYMQKKLETGESLDELVREDEIIYYEEGVDINVSVHSLGKSNVRFLRVNGKTDASTGGDMVTQELVGHIPMMLYGGSEPRVLVIGLASGVTVGSVTRYPIKQVDVVEISEAVVRASKFFSDANYDVLKNERVNLIIGDGRNHLKLSDKKYDVIISQPTNPWIAGLASLFTVEYFQSAFEHMNDGGVFCCWVQAYNMRPKEFGILIKSFLEVFPNASMWESIPGADYIIVGFKDKYNPRYDLIVQKFTQEGVKKDLERIEVMEPAQFASRYFIGSKSLFFLTENFEVHTDNLLQLEYRCPKYLGQNTYEDLYSEILRYEESPLKGFLADSSQITEEEKQKINRYLEARKIFLQALLRDARRQWGDAKDAYIKSLDLNWNNQYGRQLVYNLLRDMGLWQTASKDYEGAIATYQLALKYMPSSTIVEDRIGAIYLEMGKIEEAKEVFLEVIKKNPNDAVAFFNLGYIEMQSDNFVGAYDYIKKALDIAPDYAEALNGLGVIAVGRQRMDEAVEYFERAIKAKPSFAEPYKNLGMVLIKIPGREKEGVAYLKTALKLNPNLPDRRLIEEMIRQSEL